MFLRTIPDRHRTRPQRGHGAAATVLLLLALASKGCWNQSSQDPRALPINASRAARTSSPAELWQLVAGGEAACGSAEAVDLLRAAYWLKRGDPRTALQHVNAVSPLGPHRLAALWIAGEALYRLGNLAQALQLLATLVAEAPDDLEGRTCLAAIYFDIGAMEQTEAELLHVLRLSPDNFRPHHLLGRIHLDFEKYSLAVLDFRRALERCPPAGPRLELQRGLAAALRGDRQYQELLDAVPPDAADDMLLALRADALWSVGRTAEARQVLDGVLQRAPQLTEALLISARLDFENGLLDRAAEQLQQLVSRDPHHVVARYQLALVQRQLGRMDQFQETMRLKEESQALIDRLVELNKQVIEQPGDAALCLEIADVCDQLGKRGLAATWRKAAAALQQASINAAAPSR